MERIIAETLENSYEKKQLNMMEFIKCMGMLTTSDFEKKIDLLFRLIDTDGNGLLSWKEVFELCMHSLAVCRSEYFPETSLLRDQAVYFADFIFDLVSIKKDQEIPLKKLKEIIKEN